MKRNHFGLLAPLCVCTFAAVTGCKKEEPPPPPLPAPQAVTTAAAPLQLRAEDAGVKPPASADAGVKKAVHGHGGGGGLGPCCAALMQNAASQPEPQKTYMLQAGQMCQAFLAQGMGKQAVGGLMGVLRGAGMPAACR